MLAALVGKACVLTSLECPGIVLCCGTADRGDDVHTGEDGDSGSSLPGMKVLSEPGDDLKDSCCAMRTVLGRMGWAKNGEEKWCEYVSATDSVQCC